MTELDDLIKFENESTSVDFKAKQYANNEDLLKDLIAMANANVMGDRHIIVGMKHFPDDSRRFWSINRADFVDSANYHQLTRDNVEPEIHFDYTPYEFEGHLLGVLRVYNCNDQPYMMRKDYGSLRRGDAWIRKGTHQPRLMRADLDRIWDKRRSEFTATIRIGFDVAGIPKQMTVPAIGKISFPSDLAAQKIQEILSKREKNPSPLLVDEPAWKANLFRGILGPPQYEHRSTQELKENLENVKDTYRDDDLYEFYEAHGTKLNLVLVNDGDRYLEDASIRIKIPKLDGLRIANRLYAQPQRSSGLGISPVSLYSVFGRDYPSVKNHKGYIGVFASVGTLRHGIPQRAFGEPLRVVFESELVGQQVLLECTLRAKQLRTPRKETLTIEITETTQSS